MRDFSIDIIWAKVQMAIAAIGGWLGYFLGGMDGLLTALIVFMAIDYVTGLMCAVADKKLSSSIGFKGICKKVLIILLVGVAHIVQWYASTFPMRAFPCWRMLPISDCRSRKS